MDAPNSTPTKPTDKALAIATSGRAAPPATIVIFGAAGDLTKRLLVPALYNLAKSGALSDKLAIVGVDHNDRSTEDWIHTLSELRDPKTLDANTWSWLTSRMQFLQGDFLDPDAYKRLGQLLAKRQQDHGVGSALFYMAVADRFFGPIIEHLGKAGLANQSKSAWRRVIIEKPFGHDLASAKALNAQILKVLSEDQIYRIDHFLGKETVQNIQVLRFANGIFEPLWNRDHIDHVQITAAETVGVETRGRFYEQTGAMRDMVPSHLFQLLAMIAMEPPSSFTANAVRNKETELFQAIHTVAPSDAVRGQYGPGTIDGKPVPGYRQEPNVAPDSSTETYVGLKLGIDTWRWAGVPFYMRTGKRLVTRTTEIAVCFRQAPYALFRDTPVERMPPNILLLRIQPDEGLSISFSAKRPGPEIKIDGVAMDFAYKDYFGPLAAVGYETLLYDCLLGDATLFRRADAVEVSWCAVQGLLDDWKRNGPKDLPSYAAGSSGPKVSDELLARDKRAWLPIKPERRHLTASNVC